MNATININLAECETIGCTECGFQFFGDAIIVKKIPAMASQTGREQEYPVQILVCGKCGKPKFPWGEALKKDPEPSILL